MATESQESVMEQAAMIQSCFIDDEQRIFDRMQRAREKLQLQNEAIDLKASLCDKIRLDKMKNESLNNFIHELKESNKSAYEYICMLERLQFVNIYCEKCEQLKTINPASNTNITRVVHEDQFPKEVAKGKSPEIQRVKNQPQKFDLGLYIENRLKDLTEEVNKKELSADDILD